MNKKNTVPDPAETVPAERTSLSEAEPAVVDFFRGKQRGFWIAALASVLSSI